nr:SCO family protein [Pseudopedobacter sp.]
MSKNKFPIFKILILVTILAVPGFLYYLLQEKGKNRYKPLPIFGPKIVDSTFHTKKGVKIPDTIYHKIPDVNFITNNADSLNLGSVKKQLILVNFFYSKDQLLTPTINQAVKSIYKEFKENNIIRFISISIDPEQDSVPVLRNYAKMIGAKPGKWDFVTMDSSKILNLAKNQFFVNAIKSSEDKGQYIFSDKLILLDADHRIRGYYSSSSVDEISKLSDEIKVLITEELRKIK